MPSRLNQPQVEESNQSDQRMVTRMPQRQGLYDPAYEHGACGLGFIVDIEGRQSNAIVRDALSILLNLDHRGATGSDPLTGDGAGILLQLPDKFFRGVCLDVDLVLPKLGDYGVGMLFLPQDAELRQNCIDYFRDVVREEGQAILGWRDVPTNTDVLGVTSAEAAPYVRQVFIQRHNVSRDDFERKLYKIRRKATNAVKNVEMLQSDLFYIPSLSCRTIVYKGMLTPHQVEGFYQDLTDLRMESAIALVHSRFSTNTFPNWARAHPYRHIIHNGEINTLRGNVNWMRAREGLLNAPYFKNLAEIFPIVDMDGSDSSQFDNVLEFLVLNGVPLAQAMVMMMPEPWQKHATMPDEKAAFYEYHACLMEPWDGPAAMAFTDGKQVGAVLDRNGLRPSRYYVTKDGRLILASEVGVLDIDPNNIAQKGRLQPGRMLLIDTEEGRIIEDEELKMGLATAYPYREWLNENLLTLDDLPPAPDDTASATQSDNTQLQLAFGYTFEDLRMLLAPMAEKGVEAIGSMGDDTPLAVLSKRSRLLYDYFKQLFAQVTNPPIDAIREELVTGTVTYLGTDGNMLIPSAENARRIKLNHPILTNDQLAKLRNLNDGYYRSATLPILYNPERGGVGLATALQYVCERADAAIAAGANLIILSDRGVDRKNAPIPALLATSAVHHHLIRTGNRVKVSLLVESAEAREVHHFACLLGYGAEAINPYLAFDSLRTLIAKELVHVEYDVAEAKYIKAIVKGIVKVCSKMGISTIQSYGGAQIFEALGLQQVFVDDYFTHTATRIEGADIHVIARETKQRHKLAYPDRPANGHALPAGGKYQVRMDGEDHAYDPATVHALQKACRNADYVSFKQYADGINSKERRLNTLRGLLSFASDRQSIPLSEVESVDEICKRFKTGAMSYGSISMEAHTTLAIAMNRIGGRSNTGEGGEARWRFDDLEAQRDDLDKIGILSQELADSWLPTDSAKSRIKQVASGRFGVTSEYLVNADEIQIKMAQGAKPGEGGQLPGHKVYPWIADVRLSTPGVGLISPPPHHDIYSIEDLAQLIFDLKNANPQARINVKLVSEVGVGTIATGVAKGHADVILISGYGGGTGAAAQTSIKHAGLPWELGLAETHQTLLLNDLRGRVRLETDGQLKTGRDVIIAALLGAEEYGFSTAPLVSIGCIMMRVCHLNTCPVGVATQNPELRKQFTGKPEHVVNFMRFIAEEVREILAELGFQTMDELIGQTELLNPEKAIAHWKANEGLDLSRLLYVPVEVSAETPRRQVEFQDHALEKTYDMLKLLPIAKPAIENGQRVTAQLPIRNVNRTVGTIVGSHITRKYGLAGLPEDTLQVQFVGSAGQSFGAFLPHGMSFALVGDANDYVGKGLSGGKIAVLAPNVKGFVSSENILIGNVALYGATRGEAYFSGMAGERFAVRNSGAHAVVEGVGDHGCEYMTGGRVVVLGNTGRNFAAGMSGGIAYVFNRSGGFASRVNTEMVDLTPLEDAVEIREVKAMIHSHVEHTRSALGQQILADWEHAVGQFVRVVPRDYSRVLQAIDKAKADGLSDAEAQMAAFEQNKLDKSRVAGN